MAALDPAHELCVVKNWVPPLFAFESQLRCKRAKNWVPPIEVGSLGQYVRGQTPLLGDDICLCC